MFGDFHVHMLKLLLVCIPSFAFVLDSDPCIVQSFVYIDVKYVYSIVWIVSTKSRPVRMTK